MAGKSLKTKYLELKKEGLADQAICKILNCNLGKLQYYNSDKSKHQQKSFSFKSCLDENERSVLFKLRGRYYTLHARAGKVTFTFKEFVKHLYENQNCYLTGIKIDFSDNESWEIDHVISVKNGGTNELCNLKPCIKWANRIKSEYSLFELEEKCNIILNQMRASRESNSCPC